MAQKRVAASEALGRLVFRQRHVGDEEASGQLELHHRAIALPAAIDTRARLSRPAWNVGVVLRSGCCCEAGSECSPTDPKRRTTNHLSITHEDHVSR